MPKGTRRPLTPEQAERASDSFGIAEAVAKQACKPGRDYDPLLSQAMEGLMYAAQAWDAAKSPSGADGWGPFAVLQCRRFIAKLYVKHTHTRAKAGREALMIGRQFSQLGDGDDRFDVRKTLADGRPTPFEAMSSAVELDALLAHLGSDGRDLVRWFSGETLDAIKNARRVTRQATQSRLVKAIKRAEEWRDMSPAARLEAKAKRLKFLRLYGRGQTLGQIGKALSLTVPAVKQWVRLYEPRLFRNAGMRRALKKCKACGCRFRPERTKNRYCSTSCSGPKSARAATDAKAAKSRARREAVVALVTCGRTTAEAAAEVGVALSTAFDAVREWKRCPEVTISRSP